ncbi:hypothetical protein BAUCODRAFT_312878 [Baudoinia panamericana UAMH 10762]|uniref:DRBM domain-containing protein n=1 Tax=Baudoinia panamericana (strain UAMH 10762) TaxID=717646 RepID=M2LDG0_BAUPA|nr:uncharacterized protein BAUCODRAFT_312878 [Baudoinia panamericana UAMH 10762]EMC91992.1 hypothetical protein BAUCODRAFT_312878 [Baudoinia panamericana UAMH 10762]
MIRQRGSDNDKALFNDELKKQMNEANLGESPPVALENEPHTRTTASSRASSRDRSTSQALRLCNSLKALNESGDWDGIYPAFEEETKLSDRPPSFMARMTFKGRTFEAESRTKKEARRMVALRACDAMGIAVM